MGADAPTATEKTGENIKTARQTPPNRPDVRPFRSQVAQYETARTNPQGGRAKPGPSTAARIAELKAAEALRSEMLRTLLLSKHVLDENGQYSRQAHKDFDRKFAGNERKIKLLRLDLGEAVNQRHAAPLTPEQLANVERSHEKGDVAATWELLAQYGDTYAAAAASGIKDPTSLYGHAIRNSWYAARADLSKFDDVAMQHQKNYIKYIQDNQNMKGSADLPTSTQIETSYYYALKSQGITPLAAIDLLMSKVSSTKASVAAGVPNWHDWAFGTGIDLEDNRKGPPSPQALGLDLGEASMRLAYIMNLSGESLTTWGAMSTRSHLPEWLLHSGDALAHKHRGASPILSRDIGGFNVYYNTKTHTMAMFDHRGFGHVWVDGKWHDINPGNWKVDPKATDAERYQGRSYENEAGETLPEFRDVYQFKHPGTGEWKRASLPQSDGPSHGTLDAAFLTAQSALGYLRMA